jgi:hypothetical protein
MNEGKKMISKNLMIITALALASSLALAGAVQPFSVIVELNDDGSGTAGGDMVTARTSANDFELIGCGIKAFQGGGAGQFGFCQAADSNDNFIVCTTTNTHLLEAIKGIGDYSFVRFDVNKKGACTRIDLSTQSFYLPSNVTGN